MNRVRALHSRGQVESHAEVARRLGKPGDYVLVHRGVPRSIVMNCPDGCGEMLTVNLDPRSGKAWRIDARAGRVTLYPSIWRQQGCRAHFIVWRDAVLWCDAAGDGWATVEDEVVEAVRKVLQKSSGRFMHYEELADSALVHPWEALWAAHVLKRRGLATEKDAVYFGLAAGPSQRRGTWA